jgi:NADH dehydrogenase (ubiquinone) 1 alpha subcomplex subunit 6
MYSLNLPVSTIRTKIRQEFERHRYVQQLQTVDVLLFKSHSEFQVRRSYRICCYEVEGVGMAES